MMRRPAVLFANIACIIYLSACSSATSTSSRASGGASGSSASGGSSNSGGQGSLAGSAPGGSTSGSQGGSSTSSGGTAAGGAGATSAGGAAEGGSGNVSGTWHGATSATVTDALLQTEYSAWKTAHTQACSNGSWVVVKDGSVVSEGIGYGMLLAAGMNDQPLFDNLWKYYQDHLDSNGLMNGCRSDRDVRCGGILERPAC